MNNVKVSFKQAQVSDIDVLLSLLREYYAYENLQLDDGAAQKRLTEFIGEPLLGNIWLIAVDSDIAGYIVVTNGYGLEHGRNVTIDEFYVCERFRGQGLGRKTMQFVLSELHRRGIESIHTEVERDNTKALKFWTDLGFHKHDRYSMVKMLLGG
jgi:ribosomal protein S18 acetylase RimI-like enzyme